MNETVMQIQGESRDVRFKLNASGVTLGGFSDDIREGRYVLKCTDAVAVPKKDRSGVNIRFTDVIVAPDCSEKGKTVVSYHPVPIGPDGDEETRKKGYYLTARSMSAASLRGEELDGEFENSPREHIGTMTAAYVTEDTDNQGNPVGTIKNYITGEMFKQNPGPVGTDRGSARNVDQNEVMQRSIEQNTVTAQSQAQNDQQSQAQQTQTQQNPAQSQAQNQTQPPPQGGNNASGAEDPLQQFLNM